VKHELGEHGEEILKVQTTPAEAASCLYKLMKHMEGEGVPLTRDGVAVTPEQLLKGKCGLDLTVTRERTTTAANVTHTWEDHKQ
jgi:hypothetical protein